MIDFITDRVYIIDSFKMSLLININILKIEEIVFNCSNNLIFLKSHCEFIIKMLTISTYDVIVYYNYYIVKFTSFITLKY